MGSFSVVLTVMLAAICALGQHRSAAPLPSNLPELHWTASAVPGLKLAVVSGDPAGKGPLVLRLRADKEVCIPPHRHPADEQLMVVTGTVSLGMGDQYVAKDMRQLHQGKDVLLPKGTSHYALFEAGSEVEIRGQGPFKNEWVNPDAIKALQKDVDSNSERSKMKAEQDKQ